MRITLKEPDERLEWEIQKAKEERAAWIEAKRSKRRIDEKDEIIRKLIKEIYSYSGFNKNNLIDILLKLGLNIDALVGYLPW